MPRGSAAPAMPPDLRDIMQATHGKAEELPVFSKGGQSVVKFEASESGNCVSFMVAIILIKPMGINDDNNNNNHH